MIVRRGPPERRIDRRLLGGSMTPIPELSGSDRDELPSGKVLDVL
jgi:hypothetical protein